MIELRVYKLHFLLQR